MTNARKVLLLLSLVWFARAGAATVADPTPLQAELAAANALLQERKIPEARAAFEKILAASPNNPSAHSSIALLACEDGDWEKALRHASKAIGTEPNHAHHQYVWGAANGIAALKSGVFAKLGHAKKCLAAYKRAVELEPESIQYRWALLNYYQQAPGVAGGDKALAYAQAEEIKKLDPERGRQALVQVYMSDKKYELAFAEYDELLRRNPDDHGVLYQFGRLTLMSGQRLDEGMAAFRHCLTLPPPNQNAALMRADLHWRLGNVWEAKNQLDDARKEYNASLKENPAFRPALRALEKLDQTKK